MDTLTKPLLAAIETDLAGTVAEDEDSIWTPSVPTQPGTPLEDHTPAGLDKKW